MLSDRKNLLTSSKMYSGVDLPCPSINENLQSREDEEVTKNVTSWSACKELCRQKEDCKAWTWHHKDADGWAFQCITMTGYGYTNYDTNVVSGGRDCETGTFQPCTSRRHRSTCMDVYLKFKKYIWSISGL